MIDATERFSTRVADYVKYRPSYPRALFDALEREGGLGEPSVVADVGSGSGIATAPLLERGHRVYAVEPNDEMRAAAERALGEKPGFVSLAGRAEATTLGDAPGHPAYERFYDELGRLHDAYAVNGGVRFEYVSRLYVGELSAAR